jgi:hypothetical protein
VIDPNQNVLPLPDPPLQQTSSGLPLPEGAELSFWREEVDRSDRAQQPYLEGWKKNIEWYEGKKPSGKPSDYVNVNVDFYEVEQKLPQLFFETPELQMEGKGPLKGQDPLVQAHRSLINEITGPDFMNVLEKAVKPAIKDCLAVSGVGPVILGYQPTLREVQPPMQPGSILGLNGPVQVPIYQQWYALRFSPKKLLIPADWHDKPGDDAPWLGMRFRMPLTVAIREKLVPPNFEGSTARDEHVLTNGDKPGEEASGTKYIDGQMLFYKATVFDPAAFHPELYRELVLVDKLDQPARHRDCPHQTILPDGRMSADSMIGNPIHPLSIRTVPDSAYVPSDTAMTRGLVEELCTFRTQQMRERDANITRILYDTGKFPPEVLKKIEDGTTGTLIGVEEGTLNQGVNSIMAPVVQGQTPRQTYIAQEKIESDLAKTLALDATGVGVTDNQDESATKTAELSRTRNVRLDGERGEVLRWYLGLIAKVSPMVCRYMTPQLAIELLGQEQAMLWLQWDKRTTSSRIAISAKPDSQIRLDAQAERTFALKLYEFSAKDPNVNRVELLKWLFTLSGLDPSKLVVEQLPQKPPEEGFTFSFKGEDLVGPQAPIVLEILAQGGIQISQQAHDEAAGQMFKQMSLGIRDASGKVVPPANANPEGHGGPVEKMRPLSKQHGDATGDRSGPKSEAPAA